MWPGKQRDIRHCNVVMNQEGMGNFKNTEKVRRWILHWNLQKEPLLNFSQLLPVWGPLGQEAASVQVWGKRGLSSRSSPTERIQKSMKNRASATGDYLVTSCRKRGELKMYQTQTLCVESTHPLQTAGKAGTWTCLVARVCLDGPAGTWKVCRDRWRERSRESRNPQ